MLFDNQVLSGSGIENQAPTSHELRLQEFSGAGSLFVIALRRGGGKGSLPGNECGQATKGIRWMFWRQESMKDVAWLR